jgi:hypothetical protein
MSRIGACHVRSAPFILCSGLCHLWLKGYVRDGVRASTGPVRSAGVGQGLMSVSAFGHP